MKTLPVIHAVTKILELATSLDSTNLKFRRRRRIFVKVMVYFDYVFFVEIKYNNILESEKKKPCSLDLY